MEEKLLPYTTRDDNERRRPSALAVLQVIAGGLQLIAYGVLLVSPFLVFAATVSTLLYQVYTDVSDPSRRPEIFMAVDGCSGLDNAGGVTRAFNLTVAVDNLGGKYNVHVGAGDAVVLYGGVPLATGVVQDLFVPPHGAREAPLHAASGGVGLPDELAVAMAEEMKRAGGVVELEVRVLSLNGTSLMCTANLNLGGGAPAPASAPCERLVLLDESDGVMKHLLSYGKYDEFF